MFGIYIFRCIGFCVSCFNYVGVCVFMVLANCVLVVSPEEGSSLLSKRSVSCAVFFMTTEEVLANAAVTPCYKFR